MNNGLLKEVKRQNMELMRESFRPKRGQSQGIVTSVEGSTCVGGRPRHVYVTDTRTGFRRQVFNRNVKNPPPNGLVVNIGYADDQSTREEVLGIDPDQVFIDRPEWDGEIYDGLGEPHASTHIIKEGLTGSDPLHVFSKMLNMLRTWPEGGLILSVSPLVTYKYDNRRKSFPGGEIDLTDHVPDAGFKRMVMIYLDKRDNKVIVLPALAVPDHEAVPYRVPATPAHGRVSSYVTLVAGQTLVSHNHIFEGRDFLDGDGGMVAASDTDDYPRALEDKIEITGYAKSVDSIGNRQVLTFTPPPDGVESLSREFIMELLFMGLEVFTVHGTYNTADTVELIPGKTDQEIRIVGGFISSYEPAIAQFVNMADLSDVDVPYELPKMQRNMSMWYPDAPHFRAKTNSGLGLYVDTDNANVVVSLNYVYADSY